MRKIIYSLLCFLFASFSLIAQEKSKKDYIQSLKIAFITDNLDLSSKEAQQFWPVYNRFEERKYQEVYRKFRAIKQQLNGKSYEQLPADQASDILNQYLQIEKNKYEIEKGLIEALKGIIPPSKILHMEKLEDDFRHQLLDKLKKEYHNQKN